MKLRIYLTLISFSFLILCCSKKENEVRYKYDIDEYLASFVLSDTTTDVKVCLDITYNIFGENKSDGYKYVDNNIVSNLRCYDDLGNKLQCEVIPHKDNKIAWYFPLVTQGKKRIKVEFIIKDLLIKTENKYILDVQWVGYFLIPVKKSAYIIYLSFKNNIKIISIEPGEYINELKNNRRIIINQSPLQKKNLYLQFQAPEN